MRKTLLAATLGLTAACSGGGGNNDQIQPGNWETTTRMTSVEAPGMPEEALKQMRAQLANQTQTQTSCITAEQAANPMKHLVDPEGEENGCDFSKSTFANGQIAVQGSCPGPNNQGSMKMAWSGRYTATTMEGQVQTAIEAGPQSMKMAGTMSARRVGDCPATKQET